MSPLHLNTPLLRAPPELFGECTVWLKMDALQPGGSFKMRGVGRLVQQRVAQGAKAVVCASGGNAGMAATLAARACGVPATIVVPRSTATAVREAIAARGASLGARRVAPRALAVAVAREHEIISLTVSDAQAVHACTRLADTMRVLVEPACGAALAALDAHPALFARFKAPLVEVCGGIGVSLTRLAAFRRDLGLD